LDKYDSLHKNGKMHGINAHENTMYYEMYQTIDLVFFHVLHSKQALYKKFHIHILYIFLALSISQEIANKCT
jgi:hypothetical protein